MMRIRIACTTVLFLGLLVAVRAGATGETEPSTPAMEEAPDPTPPVEAAPEPMDALDLADIPALEPPRDGEPTTRVGGATRSPGPSLFALVPEWTGLTLSRQPVLYWYLGGPHPGPLELALGTPEGAYLVQDTIEGPWEPGTHAIDLSRYDVSLEPGTDYHWIVALPPTKGSSSIGSFAGGGIRLVEAETDLSAELNGSDEARRALIYIRHGIWYEALDALSKEIDARPADPRPRRQRAALLEQVGLDQPARGEPGAPR